MVTIIKRNPNKREQLIEVLYSYGHSDSLSRLRLVKKIKEYLGTDLNTFISILAYLSTYSYE